MNPYESPQAVQEELQSDSDEVETRTHLSNRVMALVIGVPGLLFLSFGLIYLIAALRTTGLVIGGVGLTMGTAMLWVSLFLWRYDSTH